MTFNFRVFQNMSTFALDAGTYNPSLKSIIFILSSSLDKLLNSYYKSFLQPSPTTITTVKQPTTVAGNFGHVLWQCKQGQCFFCGSERTWNL